MVGVRYLLFCNNPLKQSSSQEQSSSLLMNLQLGRDSLSSHAQCHSGAFRAGGDLLAGGWNTLKAHSCGWHLTLPEAGVLSWSDQPKHVHEASPRGSSPFSQSGGWVSRVSFPINKAETRGIFMTWPLVPAPYSFGQGNPYSILETFFFDTL